MFTCPQYFTFCAMVAMIGSAIFIRMNWLFKAVLNIIAFIIYTAIIAGSDHCLFDNYDLTVYGICAECESHPQSKWTSGVSLAAVLVATIILGRSVSWEGVVYVNHTLLL